MCIYNETSDIRARNFQQCHPKMEKSYSLGVIKSVRTSCHRSFRKWACLSGRLYGQKKDFAEDLTTSCSQTAPCWLQCSVVEAPEMNCDQIQQFSALKLFFESHISNNENGKRQKVRILKKKKTTLSFIPFLNKINAKAWLQRVSEYLCLVSGCFCRNLFLESCSENVDWYFVLVIKT